MKYSILLKKISNIHNKAKISKKIYVLSPCEKYIIILNID